MDMELGAEDDADTSKVPERIRLILFFVGEGLVIIGGILLYLSLERNIPEGIALGIGLILSAVVFCVVPIVALELRKYKYAAEILALDSQTQMQDYDWWEQIDVEDYELIMIPQYTLAGEMIQWNEEELEESIAHLKQCVTRVGGKSLLNPTVLDKIVDSRIREIIADDQEYNVIQRFFCWLFRINPQVIAKDYCKLAEDWISFTMDRGGITINNRIGLFSMGYDEYTDINGEILVAQTEKLQTIRSHEEEDIGRSEEVPCGTQAWEVREIRAYETKAREEQKFINRAKRKIGAILNRSDPSG
jgi:hypothetical protein